jgi:hypothetical protein
MDRRTNYEDRTIRRLTRVMYPKYVEVVKKGVTQGDIWTLNVSGKKFLALVGDGNITVMAEGGGFRQVGTPKRPKSTPIF